MKWLLACLLLMGGYACAQHSDQIRMMEDQADVEDVKEVEEDLIQLQAFLVKPLNLNKAGSDELSVFPFLTPFHIEQLIRYRTLAGDLVHVLEIQAIPGWGPELIRKIMPYATVKPELSLRSTVGENIRKGTHMVLFRSSLSAQAAFLARYHFTSPNLQWGVNTEKDGGEKYLQPGKGLAFVSAHISLRNIGLIKQLVAGDFIVNMGQGLIHWQGRAVRKTAMPMAIKRQLPFLQPYRSNDENRYFRGLGMHVVRKRFDLGVFISANRLDANRREDTVSGRSYVSSFLQTGYHRTAEELADKNVLGHVAVGGMMAYQAGNFRVGVNVIKHRFSLPVIRADELYNVFAARGRNMTNYGLHYHKTWRNIHLFGELAFDGEGDPAVIQGMMVAADPRLDFSIVARRIAKSYRSFQGNAFTESGDPSNEEAIYAGFSYRILPVLTLDVYADHYRFPWLRYRVDAPGWGKDHLFQLSYRPDKKTAIYIRYRVERKSGAGLAGPMRSVAEYEKHMGRLHIEFRPGMEWEWRFRMEVNSLMNRDFERENGFLTSSDLFWTPLDKSVSLNARVMIYDTKSYDSRIYSFENDVLYYNIVPAFYGRGARVYLNTHYKFSRNWHGYMKISRSFNGFKEKWNTRFQVVFHM